MSTLKQHCANCVLERLDEKGPAAAQHQRFNNWLKERRMIERTGVNPYPQIFTAPSSPNKLPKVSTRSTSGLSAGSLLPAAQRSEGFFMRDPVNGVH